MDQIHDRVCEMPYQCGEIFKSYGHRVNRVAWLKPAYQAVASSCVRHNMIYMESEIGY